ncbi:MAG: precorrin-8X methylmutase [Pleurocapsa sp.]
MDLHITDASALAQIDCQVEALPMSPAEYEIVRQVIYYTADFEYSSIIKFNHHALAKGAAAIAARSTIIVDIPAIQVQIVPKLQKTFCNPVYCCSTTAVRPQKRKTKAAWGLETLAKTHPDDIYVIGQDATALGTLAELTARKATNPALIIFTAPMFIEQDMKQWLIKSAIPSIYIDNPKGNATVATAIVNSLIDLTWQAYEINSSSK